MAIHELELDALAPVAHRLLVRREPCLVPLELPDAYVDAFLGWQVQSPRR
jgi:hypothetical protein